MPVAPEEESEQLPPLRPYDPASVRATSPGPLPSSTAPGAAQEPQPAPDAPRAGLAKVLPFDRRYARPLEGLIYLGATSVDFHWCGHHFVIRTLKQGEELMVPLLIQQWRGLLGEEGAMATAMAALCVVTIDGQELPIPLGGDDPMAWATQRFEYAKGNWDSFVVQRVYNELLALEGRVREVIEALEKASAPQVSTPTSSDTSA